MTPTRTNRVIVASIPLNRNMKSYFVRKFEVMCSHNGEAYASDRFKKLKETLMAYRASSERPANRAEFVKLSGFRPNGWVRMLFEYMDSQPNYALQLAKLYCGLPEPVVSVEQSAEAQHQLLGSVGDRVNCRVPRMLTAWLDLVSKSHSVRDLRATYVAARKGTGRDAYRRFCKSHSFSEFLSYCRKWHKILSPRFLNQDDADLQSVVSNAEPTASFYKDSVAGEVYTSKSFDEDLLQLAMMPEPPFEGFGPNATSPLSHSSYEFVLSHLTDEADVMMMSLLDDEGYVHLPVGRKGQMIDGLYVGSIHHIPKTGTVKRRPIAAPNRFIQQSLAGVAYQLQQLLQRLPQDCTFAQQRHNATISQALNRQGSYVGSVDLSQATDHLPLQWMVPVWDYIFKGKVCPEVAQGWDLFNEVARANWNNEGYLDRWTVGQPLGTLPSFPCLGITHNLVCESLAFTLGMAHSPYAVLGDDLVCMSRVLRKGYIKLMQNAGVPLSLHKSYDENLVEFAGQVFVRNMCPFYITDHKPVTWNSLFDYQWATGIYLPWKVLPNALRRKWVKACSLEPKSNMRESSVAARLYRIAFLVNASSRGSSNLQVSEDEAEVIASAILSLESTQDTTPDPVPTSGLVVAFGHPMDIYGYHDTFKQAWIRKPTPQWFRDKYRPVATDTLAAVVKATMIRPTLDVPSRPSC